MAGWGGGLLLGAGLGIGQWLVSNCVMHHLFVCSIITSVIAIIISLPFLAYQTLFISTHELLLFFSPVSLPHAGDGGREGEMNK